MIDEKTLAEDEREQKMLADHYANKPEMVLMFKKRIAVIRNARRYLALREHGVLMGMPHNMTLAHDEKLDAAADRLLEGGGMMTLDDALSFADRMYTKSSFAGELAAEVRRLQAENERLAGCVNKLKVERAWAIREVKRLTEENERLRKDAEQNISSLRQAIDAARSEK